MNLVPERRERMCESSNANDGNDMHLYVRGSGSMCVFYKGYLARMIAEKIFRDFSGMPKNYFYRCQG